MEGDPLSTNLLNFTQYGTILREDSSITLPQAGVYKGPDAFMEYVKFKTSFGDYFSYGPDINAWNHKFNGYDNETHTCEYLRYYQAEYHMDDRFATVAQQLNLTFMIKYQMSYKEGPLLKKAFVYYTSEWLTFLFDDMLNNDKVSNYICGQLVDSCNNAMDGLPRTSCLERFDNLPLVSSDQAHVDGNSKGCRELHVVMAGMSPEIHCPHIAYTPTEDPNGKIKCQTSLGKEPGDYFTSDDIEFLNQLQRSVGVDPIRGFKLREEYDEDAEGDGNEEGKRDDYDYDDEDKDGSAYYEPIFSILIAATVLTLFIMVWCLRDTRSQSSRPTTKRGRDGSTVDPVAKEQAREQPQENTHPSLEFSDKEVEANRDIELSFVTARTRMSVAAEPRSIMHWLIPN